MGKLVLLVLFLLSLTISGCRSHLSEPENIDPVYLDVKNDLDKTLLKVADIEKDVERAREAFINAPIRTGLRQDALEDFFVVQKKKQALIEKYRYLALKTSLTKKNDRAAYERAYKENKPWPNTEDYVLFQTEKKLAQAPREWDPINRIKKRAPSSVENTEKKETHH